MTSTTIPAPRLPALCEPAAALAVAAAHPVVVLADGRLSIDPDERTPGRVLVMPAKWRDEPTGPIGLTLGGIITASGHLCAVVRHRTPSARRRRIHRRPPVFGPRPGQPMGVAA